VLSVELTVIPVIAAEAPTEATTFKVIVLTSSIELGLGWRKTSGRVCAATMGEVVVGNLAMRLIWFVEGSTIATSPGSATKNDGGGSVCVKRGSGAPPEGAVMQTAANNAKSTTIAVRIEYILTPVIRACPCLGAYTQG
jgi:hypothetical protein